ncbi:MAG: DUF192 domain-containing protein [Patescibacteria group bacterium]|nr:DUF192 domain-containing protein [Patescibacteria group bacterium]
MSHELHQHTSKVSWFLIIIILIFVAFLVQIFRTPAYRLDKIIAEQQTESIELRVRSLRLQVKLAKTSQEQARGLSGRESLGEFEGMLFSFERPAEPSFWMKDMNFPIDILWLDSQLRIIEIEHNVQPDSFPQTFSPPQPIRYVLEVNAGLAENFNLQTGDGISL